MKCITCKRCKGKSQRNAKNYVRRSRERSGNKQLQKLDKHCNWIRQKKRVSSGTDGCLSTRNIPKANWKDRDHNNEKRCTCGNVTFV